MGRAPKTCRICSALMKKGKIHVVCETPRDCPNKDHPDVKHIIAKREKIYAQTKNYREIKKAREAARLLTSTSHEASTVIQPGSCINGKFETFRVNFFPKMLPCPNDIVAAQCAFLMFLYAEGDSSKFSEIYQKVQLIDFHSLFRETNSTVVSNQVVPILDDSDQILSNFNESRNREISISAEIIPVDADEPISAHSNPTIERDSGCQISLMNKEPFQREVSTDNQVDFRSEEAATFYKNLQDVALIEQNQSNSEHFSDWEATDELIEYCPEDETEVFL